MQIIDGNQQFEVPADFFCAMLFECLHDDQKDKLGRMLRESRGKIPMPAIRLSVIVGPTDGLPSPPR